MGDLPVHKFDSEVAAAFIVLCDLSLVVIGKYELVTLVVDTSNKMSKHVYKQRNQITIYTIKHYDILYLVCTIDLTDSPPIHRKHHIDVFRDGVMELTPTSYP